MIDTCKFHVYIHYCFTVSLPCSKTDVPNKTIFIKQAEIIVSKKTSRIMSLKRCKSPNSKMLNIAFHGVK